MHLPRAMTLLVNKTDKLFILCCLWVAACNFHESKLPPSDDWDEGQLDSPIRFSLVLEKVIRPRCFDCHASDNSKSGIDFSDYSSVKEYLTPKKPEESDFYLAVKENRMPQPPLPPLSEKSKRLIYRWIEQGAQP